MQQPSTPSRPSSAPMSRGKRPLRLAQRDRGLGGEGGGEGGRLRPEAVRRHDAVHEPDANPLFGRDDVAQVDELAGPREADAQYQALRPPEPRNEAEVDLGLP